MILWQIFHVFFRISIFAVGGAYSFLPLIQKEAVERYGWLTNQEFLEVLGMVQIFPGAISIKFATYIGHKTAGIPGAIIANAANMITPIVLILIVTHFYHQYRQVEAVKSAFQMIQLVVFAMIIAVAFQMIPSAHLMHIKNLVVIVIAFCLFVFLKAHPAWVILGAGVVGAVIRF